MAEEDKSEEKSAAAAGSAPVAPGMISLDDIDKFLEEDDPDFAMSLQDIDAEELKSDVEIDSMDIDETGMEEEEGDEKAVPQQNFLAKLPQVKAVIQKVSAPARAFPGQSKSLFRKIKITLIDWVKAALIYSKTELPERIMYGVSQVKELIVSVKLVLKTFWGKSWIEKLIFFSAGILILAFSVLVTFNFKGRWIPIMFPDYIKSLEDVADKTREFDEKEIVLLNEAFLQPSFTVLMGKIVLNLTRSAGHPNPMGAFKFYVDVDSQETAVEVKDRETELLDYVQRALEELTYDEINGPGGRTLAKSLVRVEINKVLNQGRVQDVFIEIFITKP